MAPAIPDRWLDYKPIGKRVEGTRFIAFKVPLRKHVVEYLEEELRLDGDILLKKVPNLGMIIDLTNTNRYYDPSFFHHEGVQHRKLMIPGHVTPPDHLVQEFNLLVIKFLNSNKDNDKLIGVHCTHGVNRTGYLICNYMISEMSVEPRDAIKRFDAARGHKIERTNYLEALHDLSNTGRTSKTETNWRISKQKIDTATHSIRNNHKSTQEHNGNEQREFDRRDRFQRCRDEARPYNNKPRNRHQREYRSRSPNPPNRSDNTRNNFSNRNYNNGNHNNYNRNDSSTSYSNNYASSRPPQNRIPHHPRNDDYRNVNTGDSYRPQPPHFNKQRNRDGREYNKYSYHRQQQ